MPPSSFTRNLGRGSWSPSAPCRCFKNNRLERQRPIPIHFRGKHFDEGFRAVLIVNGLVLVELKSLETLARVHKKQVLTYLKLSGIKLGLLINFGGELLKGNVERLVLNLEEPSL